MSSGKIRGIIIVCLSFIIAAGTFFRLFHLGIPAFRADTIEFWRICHQSNLSVFYLFGHWIEIVGRTAQFPLPMFLAKGFIDLFHLPPSDFFIRFPSAFFGILAIPAVFMAGRQLGRWKFGLFVAALLALNPFHIQMSREAYYYTPLLLGAVLMLWSVAWLYRHRRCDHKFPVYYFGLTTLGFALLTYSHQSGWWLALFLAPFSMTLALWRAKMFRRGWRDLIVLGVIFFVIGLPLLIVSWGVPYIIYDFQHAEIKEFMLKYGGNKLPSAWVLLSAVLGRMVFGVTPPRFAFTTIAVTAGCVAAVAAWRNKKKIPLLIAASILAVLAVYYIIQGITATGFCARHQSVILPGLLLFVAYGVWHLGLPRRFARKWNKNYKRRLVAWTAIVFALALNVWPAVLCTRLTGKPTPYKEIARACDNVLPPGVLILVDRWFDPWNELRIYNSTNVFFAFTVPDEPMETYVKNRWRDTALDFFKRFPDAGYLELNRCNRDLRGIVSSVPFARKITFTNLAALKLRDLGLAYRDDCYGPDSNRLIIDLFYNTREDVVARARNEGQKILALYGQGWSYAKLWQKTGDFRDWRVMRDRAVIDVYNLTPEPVKTGLTMRGMAANGAKRINSGNHNASHDFTNLRLEEWSLPPLTLPPGLTKIDLKDPMWPATTSALFVDFIKTSELPTAQTVKLKQAGK